MIVSCPPSPTVSDTFSDLAVVNNAESFKLVTTVAPSGSYTDDIALLPPTLPTKKTPASFAYRLDSKVGGAYEWMMITFVPDDAGVSESFRRPQVHH